MLFRGFTCMINKLMPCFIIHWGFYFAGEEDPQNHWKSNRHDFEWFPSNLFFFYEIHVFWLKPVFINIGKVCIYCCFLGDVIYNYSCSVEFICLECKGWSVVRTRTQKSIIPNPLYIVVFFCWCLGFCCIGCRSAKNNHLGSIRKKENTAVNQCKWIVVSVN